MTINAQMRGILGVAALSMRSAKPSRQIAVAQPLSVEDWERKTADELLCEWHDWSAAYRPALGVPSCSPTSRQAISSKQWQSTYEILDETVRRSEMEAVEYCVDALPTQYRQAIRVEMLNRACKTKVWRGLSGGRYYDALQAILPLMKKKGLLGTIA